MRAVTLLVLLLLTSCAQPAASPAAHVATASPKPPAGGDLSCRIPVVWSPYEPGGGTPANRWGFVVLPAVKLEPQPDPLPVALPYQLTWPGLSYDRAVNRWLPVSSSAVSADGTSYAYADYDPPRASDGKAVHANSGSIHIVDLRTAADRVVYRGSPSYGVVALGADAVYLTRVGTGYTPAAFGLYRLSLSGGSPELLPGLDGVTQPAGWTITGDGVAWTIDFSSAVPTHMGLGNELIRYDLGAGTAERWWSVPENDFIEIAGFDSGGKPIVVTGPAGTENPSTTDFTASVVVAKGQALAISKRPAAPSAPWAADAHGVWMSGDQSVWLYASDRTVERLQVSTGGETTSPLAVAGPCA